MGGCGVGSVLLFHFQKIIRQRESRVIFKTNSFDILLINIFVAVVRRSPPPAEKTTTKTNEFESLDNMAESETRGVNLYVSEKNISDGDSSSSCFGSTNPPTSSSAP